jgi:hypothetical protein
MSREQVRTDYHYHLFLSDCVSDRFIVRDFVYSEDEIAKQREELEMADTTEKELWVRLRDSCLEK